MALPSSSLTLPVSVNDCPVAIIADSSRHIDIMLLLKSINVINVLSVILLHIQSKERFFDTKNALFIIC